MESPSATMDPPVSAVKATPEFDTLVSAKDSNKKISFSNKVIDNLVTTINGMLFCRQPRYDNSCVVYRMRRNFKNVKG
ncbi:hypothetical protein SUGI_0584250 [Cryptomeria japonica]|nr:hypothetical protein SUGI_0584250 [Cryptomeria japonica]